MPKCKILEKNLVLFYYKELEPLEQAEVESHLQVCEKCRAVLHQLTQMLEQTPSKPLIEPAESQLQILRNVVSNKIAIQSKRPRRRHSNRLTNLLPRPVYQITFATLLVFVGILIGRFMEQPPAQPALSLESLFAIERPIRHSIGVLEPFLGNIDQVKLNPAEGTIEISYNTINDVHLQGNLQHPTIRKMLKHALLEEGNPAVRLHAVKAIGKISTRDQQLEPELLETLLTLLSDEQNLGVQLQVLKVLKNIPMNTTIKDVLVRALMYNTNSALRMEAFRTLKNSKLSGSDQIVFLEIAKQDSNRFIRYQASGMEENLQNQKSVKIEQID